MIFMNQETRVIELSEYKQQELSRQELPLEAAQSIRDSYNGKVSIEPISFQPNAGWKIN